VTHCSRLRLLTRTVRPTRVTSRKAKPETRPEYRWASVLVCPALDGPLVSVYATAWSTQSASRKELVSEQLPSRSSDRTPPATSDANNLFVSSDGRTVGRVNTSSPWVPWVLSSSSIGARWGRILAISSVSALMGNRGQVNYAAAKAGLIGAVKSLAREVASRGITVNAVAPGVIASPAVATAMDPQRIAEIVPMRRAGSPEEVADLIGFLCSDQASYITGQCISINGGMA